MSMRRPLVFERERSALLSAVVEKAFADALKQGVLSKVREQEARMIFVRRILGAIEAGESDIDKLKALALNSHQPSELGMIKTALDAPGTALPAHSSSGCAS